MKNEQKLSETDLIKLQILLQTGAFVQDRINEEICVPLRELLISGMKE